MTICNYCQKDLPEIQFEFLKKYGFRRHTCRSCVDEYFYKSSKQRREKKENMQKVQEFIKQDFYITDKILQENAECN